MTRTRDRATQSRLNDPASNGERSIRAAKDIAFASTLTVLAALSSYVSQLRLAPVYGAIPASTYHQSLIAAAFAVSLSSTYLLPPPPVLLLRSVLPVHASFIPLLSHYLSLHLSSILGPSYGPLTTELLTLFPLFIGTCWSMGGYQPWKGELRVVMSTVLCLLCYALFYATEATLNRYLPIIIGMSSILSTWSLEFLVTIAYVMLCPSRLSFGILPAVFFTLCVSTHGATLFNLRSLERTLYRQGFSLLERQQSLTGYISVLQNEQEQYRVLRCDHSLLGGNWLPTPARARDGIVVPETIYPVFTMLEAVRLMQAHGGHTEPASPHSALVIGLGIGTCPTALVSHGIDTTVIEIDSTVTSFARKYFDLPQNVTVIEDDAISRVAEMVNASESFDSVVHDVFTGGAEPAMLFTVEFLTSLRGVLKPHGSVAINYAGDLKLESTTVVVNTARSVFEGCQIFRESPAENDSEVDFTNMVIFCKAGPWSFREPVESDYLRSQARRHSLLPRHQVKPQDLVTLPAGSKVLSEQNLEVLERTQRRSAENHWRIMRAVLPAVVWVHW